MPTFSFPKEEKLKSTKIIDKAFSEGLHVFSYPLKFVYIFTPEPVTSLPKIGVSVSARTFKKSTDRNLIKRRMREAYRLNKHQLIAITSKSDEQFNGMFIYVAKEILTYHEIEIGLKKLYNKLAAELSA